ncbi:MAG: hypothetical protein QXS54_00850 [Candidatus Methanomethylicaceae archaeon]
MLWAEWGAKEALAPLAESQGGRLVVEHWDRLTEFGFEIVRLLWLGWGKRVVVVEEGEVANDLAQDLLEILTSACGCLYGRRSARDWVRRTLEAVECG